MRMTASEVYVAAKRAMDTEYERVVHELVEGAMLFKTTGDGVRLGGVTVNGYDFVRMILARPTTSRIGPPPFVGPAPEVVEDNIALLVPAWGAPRWLERHLIELQVRRQLPDGRPCPQCGARETDAELEALKAADRHRTATAVIEAISREARVIADLTADYLNHSGVQQ